MAIEFYQRQALTRLLTAAEVDSMFAGLALGGFQKHIATVANGDSTVVLKAPFGGTILETTSQTDSGTCTVTFKVNSTVVGTSANAASTTLQTQTHATGNTFVAGDKILMTISANASALNLAVSIKTRRTID